MFQVLIDPLIITVAVSSGNPGRRSNSGATGEHSSGKFQGYTSKHCRDDGNFGTDKWTRGRGGSLFKDGSLNRRKKDYSGGRQFDRDKSWGGKKGRGRGQQLVSHLIKIQLLCKILLLIIRSLRIFNCLLWDLEQGTL